ncbi:MAG TPA: hypothetical protein VD770_03545 [Coxiellaceae bacterium]|nr:hypothetical protein [Coxiellaceae bacterium]
MQILWSAVIVCALIILTVWIWDLKSTVKNFSTDDFKPADAAPAIINSQYIKVERVETQGGTTKILFVVENPTDDIFSFSKLEDIELKTGNTTQAPENLTDRQGRPFVQKILSKTQNFGIVEFKTIETKSGDLMFNNLFFEQAPTKMLQEKIQLNFEKLRIEQELRG